MAKVTPTKLKRELLPEELEDHAFFGCSRYEKCLYQAAIKNWKGFSCSECYRFRNFKRKEMKILLKSSRKIAEDLAFSA